MLKKYVEESNLSHEDIAENIGISRTTLHNIINEDKIPTIETIIKIKKATGLNPHEYLDLPILKKHKYNLIKK